MKISKTTIQKVFDNTKIVLLYYITHADKSQNLIYRKACHSKQQRISFLNNINIWFPILENILVESDIPRHNIINSSKTNVFIYKILLPNISTQHIENIKNIWNLSQLSWIIQCNILINRGNATLKDSFGKF